MCCSKLMQYTPSAKILLKPICLQCFARGGTNSYPMPIVGIEDGQGQREQLTRGQDH